MEKFHCFFLFLGMVFIVWFVLPVLTHRVFNIGNLTGLCIGMLLFCIGYFDQEFAKFLALLQQHRMGRIFLCAIVLLIFVVVVTAVAETFLIIHAASKKPEKNATLIILGCQVNGEEASLSLRERLDAAIRYLHENETCVCIVSGGQGSGEQISEAECMYRYLIRHGIPSSRIFKEDQSTSTRENLEYSKRILVEHGLNQKIAIATSEYHEYRAFLIARSLGLSAGAVPGQTAWWLFPTFFVRELYGILYQML